MKTQIRQPDPVSRTTQPKTKAARQVPIETMLQQYAGHTAQTAGLDEDELLQGKFSAAQREAFDEEDLLQEKTAPTQLKSENRTGLPDDLKAGVENLSGYSMDDVRIHYNSPKPAQLQALAYTQGTDIHVAPGQEKHLPHEAWHVVQQKQGRVQPTMQLQSVNINDNESLEREADVMGRYTHGYSGISMDKATTIQCEFSDLGGNAQYTSRNPQGQDGSIYFRLGRLRLIHDHGPQISIHPHHRRYLIAGNFNLFREVYKQANIQTLQELNDFFMQAGGTEWAAQLVNPNQQQPQAQGKLFEVFLDPNGNVTNTHPSRGGTAAMNNNIPVNDQRKLYYIVHYSQQFAQIVANNIDQNGILNPVPVFQELDANIEGAFMRNLFDNTPETQAEVNALDAIDQNRNNIVTQSNITLSLTTAGMNNPRRLIGFIGNLFLRHSFDLAAAGLNVRANN